jgi:hypothetical protein
MAGRTVPCQATEDANQMAILLACLSGEEPPEAKTRRRQTAGGTAEAKPRTHRRLRSHRQQILSMIPSQGGQRMHPGSLRGGTSASQVFQEFGLAAVPVRDLASARPRTGCGPHHVAHLFQRGHTPSVSGLTRP